MADTGLPPATVQLALRRLYQNGFIEAIDVTCQDSSGTESMNIQLLERGLRAVGVWPGDSYDAVLAIVSHQLAVEPNEDRKNRLQKLREGLVGVGRDVVTGVLTAFATSAIPK